MTELQVQLYYSICVLYCIVVQCIEYVHSFKCVSNVQQLNHVKLYYNLTYYLLIYHGVLYIIANSCNLKTSKTFRNAHFLYWRHSLAETFCYSKRLYAVRQQKRFARKHLLQTSCSARFNEETFCDRLRLWQKRFARRHFVRKRFVCNCTPKQYAKDTLNV